MSRRKTVLITGCTDGSLGDSLARAFHARGYRVLATVRSISKATRIRAQGVEILILDVLSTESIKSCVSEVSALTDGKLDMLVNNSGAGYAMPLVDSSIDEGRKLFDLNVWSYLAMTQAFLPLLLATTHGGMVVNNTSTVSVLPIGAMGIYSASKAATAMMTDNLRLELAPFGIKVIELKTGSVRSNFHNNKAAGPNPKLPKNSIYNPAREEIEHAMLGGPIESFAVDADQWAVSVVADLSKSKPATRIWRGGNAWPAWLAKAIMPHNFLDNNMRAMGGMDVLQRKLRK